MRKNISRVIFFSIFVLLVFTGSIVHAIADNSSNLNKVVKVTELPDPCDNPEDVGGYVLDVSDIDMESIKALPDETKSVEKIRTGDVEIRHSVSKE